MYFDYFACCIIMKLFDPYFFFFFFSWIFIKLTRIYSIEIDYLNHYLTDIFAVPAMTHLGSYMISKMKYDNQIYIYPTSYLIITALVLSILFEIIMPKISPKYTGDYIDVACYFFFVFFYHFFHKKSILKDFHSSNHKNHYQAKTSK